MLSGVGKRSQQSKDILMCVSGRQGVKPHRECECVCVCVCVCVVLYAHQSMQRHREEGRYVCGRW